MSDLGTRHRWKEFGARTVAPGWALDPLGDQTGMLHRFSTDTIDGLPSVKLIGLHITNEIPVRSTLWTMSWPAADSYARDKFYLWLVERIDRWDHWSEMVSREGARALSEHFMKLAFCDRDLSARTTMPEQD